MFNPARLTLARQRRGLNKTELARRVGLTARSISAYENDSGDPPAKTITALALVLDFPEDFFFSPTLDQVPIDGASFRSLSRMTAAQRDVARAAGSLCIALDQWLDDRFELPVAQIPELDPSVVDAEAAALLVRAKWGLGIKPVSNMVHLLEAHGVRVFSLAEDSREVDAFSFWHRGTPFVCLNTMKTPEHGVFDCAHELGHLVMHRGHSTPRGREEEQEAHSSRRHS